MKAHYPNTAQQHDTLDRKVRRARRLHRKAQDRKRRNG